MMARVANPIHSNQRVLLYRVILFLALAQLQKSNSFNASLWGGGGCSLPPGQDIKSSLWTGDGCTLPEALEDSLR